MKDVSTMQSHAPSLIRLSVHDVVAGERLGAGLEHDARVDPPLGQKVRACRRTVGVL
jgi:hypothetical protein